MVKLCTRASLAGAGSLRPARAVPAAALLLLSVASCGGSAVLAPKLAEDVSAASTPEAALAALDAAEQGVALALGGQGASGYAQPGFAQAPQQPTPTHARSMASAQPAAPVARPAEPPPPPPASAPVETRGEARQQAPRDERKADRESPRTAAEPCSTACSALASMERAADHLCDLAGGADGRCQSARERVRGATARVTAACPACRR